MIGWLAHLSYAAAAYSIEPHARVHRGRANEWIKEQRQPERYFRTYVSGSYTLPEWATCGHV